MIRPVPVPRQLIDFIDAGHRFIILGHKEPDGDCVGSQLALASALGRLGKETVLCSAGPFKRTEVKLYEGRFVKTIGERAGARVILVDCGSVDRAGDMEPLVAGLPLAVVDHHETGDHGQGTPGTVLYVDARAPAVTFMILALIEALGLTPTQEEADYLLFGLCTDTGFFRHIDAGGADTFAYASRLVRAGASPKEVFARMHGGKSLGSRILMGLVLARTESYYHGKLLLSTELYEETQRFGAEGRDSDALYQVLQAVEGVEVMVIIRQESPERCTIGLRSRDRVNVAEIAAQFGGGGHKNAAGVSLDGTIEAIKPRIIDAFRSPLEA
jgi:phosphoesterase RecJ-like protein